MNNAKAGAGEFNNSVRALPRGPTVGGCPYLYHGATNASCKLNGSSRDDRQRLQPLGTLQSTTSEHLATCQVIFDVVSFHSPQPCPVQ